MSRRLPDMLKLGGACFGLGAMAAGAMGPWAVALGLAALASGFVLPMIAGGDDR